MGNQVSLATGETLTTKHKFKHFAHLHGVTIKGYRVDNHPFASAKFRADLDLQDQKVEYSGVGAHHQLGVAERSGKTIASWARSLMMHQLEHWPEAFDEALWPFAFEHAVYIWNNLPRHRSGLTPLELFTGMKVDTSKRLQQARVWGCPACVLDPTLQDGHKLPKWQKRARCGVYLGVSPEHADSVGRVLNLETGAITPQCHVVHDELFTSVFGALTNKAMDADLWDTLLTTGGEENQLGNYDCSNPHVLDVANDLFDEFRTSNGEPFE